MTHMVSAEFANFANVQCNFRKTLLNRLSFFNFATIVLRYLLGKAYFSNTYSYLLVGIALVIDNYLDKHE